MNVFKIPFSGRPHHYTDHEIDLVVRMMESSETLTQGVMQENFEEKFANYTGVNNAFAVSSATAALELAAQLCQIQPGEEVICAWAYLHFERIPLRKERGKIGMGGH